MFGNTLFALVLFCLGILAVWMGFFAVSRVFWGNEVETRGQILERFTGDKKSIVRSNLPETNSLTAEPVISFNLTGDEVTYVTKNGQVFEIDLDTRVQRMLSDTIFLNIFRIIWSPNSNYLIYELNKGSRNRFVFLNLLNNKQWELDPSIEMVVFSFDGSKFVYISREGSVGNIFVHDSDSAEFKLLATIRSLSARISWDRGDFIYIESFSTDGKRVLFELSLDGYLRRSDLDQEKIGEEKKKTALGLGRYSVFQNETDKKLYLAK